jgi:hypothetical protein
MDGFAVRAKDTFGASSGAPAYLKLIGEVKMGESASMKVSQGETVRVSTGSMMPDGADAVVMVEYTEFLDDETIEVTISVAPGDNTVKRDVVFSVHVNNWVTHTSPSICSGIAIEGGEHYLDKELGHSLNYQNSNSQ